MGEDGAAAKQIQLGKSLYSFKTLTECPIIIALLFQTQRVAVNDMFQELVPCVIKALTLQPAQQAAAHVEAAKTNKLFYGVSPLIKNRVAYLELKALQIKTVSFLAFVLKSFIGLFQNDVLVVANCVVALMKDCPPESSSSRKELLVATRHIWQTDFKGAFLGHIDTLLDENVMTGTGVTCRETLRYVVVMVNL
jgi:transformation/transcription domain-associated protein